MQWLRYCSLTYTTLGLNLGKEKGIKRIKKYIKDQSEKNKIGLSMLPARRKLNGGDGEVRLKDIQQLLFQLGIQNGVQGTLLER
jgi:hypothetical protein